MMTATGIAGVSRRQHERSFKAELVRQCLVPGASVAAIALAGGINANLLFKWRRDHKRETIAASMPTPLTPTVLLPVHVEPATMAGMAIESTSSAGMVPGNRSAARSGVIELEFAGAQLRVRGAVDEAALCSVLRALRQSR